MRKGRLEVITGCMFTEKSLELIQIADMIHEMDKEYLAFSTIKDHLFSRATNQTIPAIKVNNGDSQYILFKAGEFLGKNGTKPTIIIDEVQFFDINVLDSIIYLLNNGFDVVVAGLDQTFKGEPFPIMRDLLCLAYEVKKKRTKCAYCGEDTANKTQRLLNGEPAPMDSPLVILDGSSDIYTYEPRCLDCFQKHSEGEK